MANLFKRKAAAPVPNELPWHSWRHRLAVLKFWRGRNRRWRFSGQQPDEEVRMVIRRHWWFLVLPALPFIISAIALLLILWAMTRFPHLASLWYILELSAFIAMVVTGGWFAYKDLVTWWYETYIITNKRIINSSGVLQPKRQQTPIERVQQVGMDIDKLLGLFLGFGTIHVYLVGGDFYLRDVPNPRRIRDAIQGFSQDYKAKVPQDVPPPKPKEEEMATILANLAKPEPIPALPNADANYPPLRGADRFIGPRRTFGGFLRIPCNVRYLSGEYTVRYVQRSLYVLWRNLLVPGLLLLIALPVTIAGPGIGLVSGNIQSAWWLGMSLIVIGLVISMLLIVMNFVDDVYILTNKRIIDIERSFFFFFEKHEETEYKNIRDINVKIQNLLQRILDIGDVYIETPGSTPNIIMSNVDHPFLLQDEILGISAHRNEEDAANKKNEEKQRLFTWFSTVIAKLEDVTKTAKTPNLKDMDLLSAMAYGQELGLDVIVRGETPVPAHTPPGHIVSQDPPPGTMMEHGSTIQVVLSKRP